MINRLSEFISQTKSISSNRWIYFDEGLSYTYSEDQLVQAFTDFKDDKKGGEFFNGKTFKVHVDRLHEFVTKYKKSITGLQFHDNDIVIKTNIPNTELSFLWDENDNINLKNIKTFFSNLDTTNIVFEYGFSKDEIAEFSSKKPSKIYIDIKAKKLTFTKNNDAIMVSILPKYLGKILASTKELSIKLYETGRPSIYLINYTVKNMNIISQYFGLTVDLLNTLKEGGLE